MKVLTVETTAPSLRAEIHGWGEEDSDLFQPGKPIGLTPGPTPPRASPATVLEALSDGWKLLGPPQKMGDVWDWWLTKER